MANWDEYWCVSQLEMISVLYLRTSVHDIFSLFETSQTLKVKLSEDLLHHMCLSAHRLCLEHTLWLVEIKKRMNKYGIKHLGRRCFRQIINGAMTRADTYHSYH